MLGFLAALVPDGVGAAGPERPWPPRAAFSLGMLGYLVEANALSPDQLAVYAHLARRWERDGFPSTPLFNKGFDNARVTTGQGRDRLRAERLAAEQMHGILYELARGGVVSERDFRVLDEKARPKGPGPEAQALAERNAREAAAADRFIAVTPRTDQFSAALEAARRGAAADGLEVRAGESKFFEGYRRSERLDDRQIMVGPIPPKLHQRLIIGKGSLFEALGRFGPTANVDRGEFMRGRPVAPGP